MAGARVHRGFTLIETVAVILVLGVLAGVTAPLMVGAAGSYADARDGRRAVEDAAFALDRLVRVLREAPAGATPGEPSFVAATATGFELENGVRVALSGTDLMMDDGVHGACPLLRDVSVFELRYRGGDGMALNFGSGDTPASTRRVDVRMRASGQELRTSVFLRVSLEGGS